MEEVIDLIATGESPSEITDAIKQVLFAKAADKVDSIRPKIAASMFEPGEGE